jgi:hypothetical protein
LIDPDITGIGRVHVSQLNACRAETLSSISTLRQLFHTCQVTKYFSAPRVAHSQIWLESRTSPCFSSAAFPSVFTVTGRVRRERDPKTV